MKEIDLLSLSKTKSETKNSPSSKVEKKEAPSLFDSLLSEVKVEKKDKESTIKTESLTTKGKKEIVEDKKSNDNKSIELKDSSKKISIKNEEKSDKKVELKDSIKTETTKETIKVKNETSTSLLDKMVLEAKKNIKENNTETKKETVSKDKDIVPNTKTDIPTKETISNEAKTDKKDTTAVEKTKDKKESVDLDKKDNKLTDNKKSTDLANSKNILNGTEQKKNIETELLDTKNKKEIKTNTSIDKNNKSEKKDETEAIKDSKDDKTEKNKDINSSTSKDILKQENNFILEIDEKLSDNKVSKVENLIKNEEIKTEKKVELKSDLKDSSSLLTPNSKKENKLDEKEVSKKEIKTEIDTSSNVKVETSSNKSETESTKNVKSEIIDNKSQRILTDKKEEKQDNKIVEQKINDVKHELKKEEKQTSEKLASSSEYSLKTIDEKKDTPSSKISSQNLNTSADAKNVKNEKVAQELSKLNTNPLENKEVSPISKDNIKSDAKDKTTLEKLLDQNKAMDKGDIVSSDKKTAEKVEPQITIKQDNKNEFLSNIYLSSQKNSMNNQSLAVKHEGVKTAKEAKNVDDIKKSAKVLNLEAKEVKVEVELSNDKDVQKTNFLNRVMLNKNSIQENIQMATLNSQNNTTTATTTSGAVTSDSSVIPESEVNINVSATATMTIQNRIIGARQQMSSMMSDVARNMYENYKPPVTAFRINLLPAQLGSIAILMKNDRESGLNISLNISNLNTLDSFIDNESGLKSALAENFGEDTEFNLDFNSGDGNNNSNAEEPKEQKRENISSTDLLNARNKTSKNPEQDTSNYM